MPAHNYPDISTRLRQWMHRHKKALTIILVIIGILAAIGVAFFSGSTGSNYQWERYSDYGISFSYPSFIPMNTSAANSSDITYDQGTLQFGNPDHQRIILSWLSTENALSQETVQNFFAIFSDGLQKSMPDLNISQVQETMNAGETIYYVIGEGHDTAFNGKMAYNVIAIWRDSLSQRDFVLATVSYTSQNEAQVIFDGVLGSFKSRERDAR